MCHAALGFEATEMVDDLDDAMFDSVAESTQDDDVDVDPEDRLEARRQLEDNPALKRLLLSE